MNKVFLGGTWSGSTWRDYVSKNLTVDYFNPVVDNWTSECQAIEEGEKWTYCNIHLYVITSEVTGVFSIAEAVCSAHDRSKHTIFHVMPDGFDAPQLKSLEAVVNMIGRLGGIAYIDDDISRPVRIINNAFR